MHDPRNNVGINSGADFDGRTYKRSLDHSRLTKHLRTVYDALCLTAVGIPYTGYHYDLVCLNYQLEAEFAIYASSSLDRIPWT